MGKTKKRSMERWAFKETELRLESESAALELVDFFHQYTQIVEQMAVDPENSCQYYKANRGIE